MAQQSSHAFAVLAQRFGGHYDVRFESYGQQLSVCNVAVVTRVVNLFDTMVQMGSTVTRGEVEATVDSTGMNTFFGKTASLIQVRYVKNLCVTVMR